MSHPKISIITVSYNSESTIEETLKSITSQEYDNMEYIIVDGGSADQTLSIIERYRKKISIVISEKDNGISDAFNKGIAMATGDIIGIINSDDIMLPDTLSTLSQEFDATTDIYRMNVIIWNPDTQQKFREIPSLAFPITPLSIHVSHQGTFVTKKAYQKYGAFDVNLKYVMDRDFLTRCYQKGASFKYINHDSSLYRMGGATNTPIRKKKADYIRLVKNNGGSTIRAYSYYCYLCFFDCCKRILNIFGEDFKRKLRYKDTSKTV